MVETVQEMRLFSPEGERLYLNDDERDSFLKSSVNEKRENRVFCTILHYTGCRPSEALELKAKSISFSERTIVFRTLKKRAVDNRGRKKLPQYRTIPVPDNVINEIDLVFDLRRLQNDSDLNNELLFKMSRTTAWRMVKTVMLNAGINGKQATAKGLRHAFGIAMLSGDRPAPLHIVRDLMGHTSSKTTECYLQAIGEEKRAMVMSAWEK